uniref:Proteasomal ATPase second OB domain-containing protein n=1 Tax=Brassica oleracea var. oleracea TaxID=109376 RepID=A0A0D3AKM4_BRAOL
MEDKYSWLIHGASCCSCRFFSSSLYFAVLSSSENRTSIPASVPVPSDGDDAARRRTAAVANYRRMIVKASSGPRYVVGCRSKVDKEKLISATRVVLDMTTLTIMRALPREAFTQHLRVSFRCYAYIPVSGQEYVQLSDCLIETLNKDEVY